MQGTGIAPVVPNRLGMEDVDKAEPGKGRLMLPAEAADLFGVDTKTLARWHKARLIGARRTLGGQRRYWEDEIRARAAEHDDPVTGSPAPEPEVSVA